jgi:hypothetical protein
MTWMAYNFRNTCHKCYNDIEFPLLGNLSDGEMIFQTKNGNRTTQIELGFATWTGFEALSNEGKLSKIKEVLNPTSID